MHSISTWNIFTYTTKFILKKFPIVFLRIYKNIILMLIKFKIRSRRSRWKKWPSSLSKKNKQSNKQTATYILYASYISNTLNETNLNQAEKACDRRSYIFYIYLMTKQIILRSVHCRSVIYVYIINKKNLS